jgi:hypothetical protein
MHFKLSRLLFTITIVILLSSCLGTTTVTTTSSNPRFVSLTFAKNSIIASLDSAKFALNADSITIVNEDSLPYKTRIDSVNPTFRFISTSRATLFFNRADYKYKKDSAVITGKDTIDFREPVRVRNFAADGKTYRDYYVKVNVHQVNPELYIWSKIKDQLESGTITNQQAALFNNTFYFYATDGTNLNAFSSANGYDWSSAKTTGMPTNNPMNPFISFNGKLYTCYSITQILNSSNGLDWNSADYSTQDYNFISLLFAFNQQLWAITQSKSDQTYHFATSVDGTTWVIRGTIPSNFPIYESAALSFSSRTGKSKVIVLGGYSADGTLLATRWSTIDGINWLDFNTQNNSLPALAEASVIAYDNNLLLFGGKSADNTPITTPIKQSIDEGLSWSIPDSTKNYLPVDFQPRYNTSVLVDASSRIFIVGGQTSSVGLSDVWTGKLNRKSFLLQ